MSELKKVIVVSVEEDDISVKLQVAETDYSAIYDATMFKQQYDKKESKWETTEESTKNYQEALDFIGGKLPAPDDEIELYVSEDTGKAYFKEGKEFKKIDKPEVAKMKRVKQAPIVEIVDSAKGRAVVLEVKDKFYSFNFNTGVWIEKLQKFIPNKAKEAKAKARFNELFEEVDVTWDNAPTEAIGLLVDCKVEKNALDQSSPFGWLDPQPIDKEDQGAWYEAKLQREEAPAKEESEDDLPF